MVSASAVKRSGAVPIVPVTVIRTSETAALPRANGGEQIAHEAAAQGEQEIFAAERPAILSALGHRPIDQDAVGSGDPFHRRRSDLLDPDFQRLTHGRSLGLIGGLENG